MIDPAVPTRWLFILFAPCALVLGGWSLLFPAEVWPLVGLDVGKDFVIATFYSAVFIAVGVQCLLGIRDPYRHDGVLLFMGIYKTVAFIVLMARAAALLGAPAGLPPMGWVLAIQYIVIAVISLWLYRALGRARRG